MTLRDVFNLNNLRSKVAQEQARAHWKFPVLFNKIKCPACECSDLIKRGRNAKGTPRFICRNCRRTFTQPPQFDCSCSVPGQLPKCSDCPHFNEFLVDWKQNIQSLKGKSFEELECLLRQEQSKTRYRELCREVAMREALLNWPPLKSSQNIECPRCQFTEFFKNGWNNGKRRYSCRKCGRSFGIESPLECNCSIPGQLPQCEDCPYFHEFNENWKRKIESLEGKSFEELERLLHDEESRSDFKELCGEVTMREALLDWPPLKPSQNIECPRCQSTQIRKRGWNNGKRRYTCRSCGRCFGIQPPFECNCTVPGQSPKCSDCPHFQTFSEQLERRTRDLLLLSREEVEQRNVDNPEKS